MSIPADTPAAVTIAPLSTNRSSGRTSIVGIELGQGLERTPPGRRGAVAEQAGGGEHERAGADARHQRSSVTEAAKPVEHMRVGELAARPAAAGIDEDVDRWGRLPGVVRQDAHSLRARHGVRGRRDGEDLDAVVGPLRRPRGEHLPRPREVELLCAVEQRDRDRCHAAIVSVRRSLAPAYWAHTESLCCAGARPGRGGARLCGRRPVLPAGRPADRQRVAAARRGHVGEPGVPPRLHHEARASATASSRSRIASGSPPRSSSRGSSASESSPKTRSKSGVTR